MVKASIHPLIVAVLSIAVVRASSQENNPCGCLGCNIVWNAMASGHSCGNRIQWLQTNMGHTEESACSLVAGQEFQVECGACNPETCSTTLTPTTLPTPSPTTLPTSSPTLEPTMAGEICGCSTCTAAVLNADAGGSTCGDRITWLSNRGHTEESACSLVAGQEFPVECLGCDPETCDGGDNNPTPTPPDNSNNKCGGAVNSSGSSSITMCENSLWQPTGDPSMHCFAYGGAGDPCHLSNNNDPNDGLDKDPSLCFGDTLYLWDEPDTQGKDYTWAGAAWAQYAVLFSEQLVLMREAGTKVTSPLVRAGGSDVIKSRIDDFFSGCGPACREPNSPAFIDIVAVNAFCGPWNGSPSYCRGGADFIVDEVRKVYDTYDLPVYVTNWSRLETTSTNDQVNAIDAIDAFFVLGSPIERVYWFGATDYGGGSANNFFTDTVGDGRTLGQVWKEKCDTLN